MARFSLRGMFAPRALATSAPAQELGYQHAKVAGWDAYLEDFEENPDLAWPLALTVYDRMRSEDPQVASVLRAVTLPIQETQWMIDPAGASDEVVAFVADDLGLPVKGVERESPLRTRDRFSWDDHLRLALLSLPFGHSAFEQVYRIEENRAHLRKLAWRPPRSISKFDVARDGGLVAIEQHGITGVGDVRIPVDRLVIYVNDREGPNWRGRSLLRSAYKMWLLKDSGLRVQAQTLERNGLGVPVYTGAGAPDTVTGGDLDKWQSSERAAGLKIAKGFRSGDTAGASIPNGATLELKGVSGKLPDTDAPIRYYDEQIARAVLAHFLNLGTETGSWALGSTFAEFFTNSLNAVASHIADVTQQHVIEDLVDVNWGPLERAPRIVATKIGEDQPATAEALKLLIDARAVTPDEPLEAYMRARYRLPVKDAATSRVDEVDGVSDAERARFAAETVQKVYLGVGPVLDKAEARALVARAGGELSGTQEGS